MIRINLLPREEKPSKEIQTWSRILIWSLIGAALVVIVGIGIHIFRSYEIAMLKGDIAEARRELVKYEGQAAMVRDLTAKRKAIEDRIVVIENIDRDRFLRVYLLDELARSVPEYVWLESCEEKAGAVTLKGMAFSNLAISQMMDDLGAKAHVDSVLLHIIRKEEVESQPVLGFELGYQIPVPQIVKPQPSTPQTGKSRGGAKSS
jgi:type IV pilus assembly protein PilN